MKILFKIKYRYFNIASLPILFLLCSCGGGSSGASGNNVNSGDNPPSGILEVSIEAPSSMVGGESKALSALTNIPEAELSFTWRVIEGQESGEVEDAESRSTTIKAARVLEDDAITIELEVNDSNNNFRRVEHTISIQVADEQKTYLGIIDTIQDPALRQCAMDSPARTAAELNSLACSDRGINSLTGLSQLENIATLDFSNNAIDDISELESMTGIVNLTLDGNQITEFASIAKIESLRSLSITSSDNNFDFSFMSEMLNLERIIINGIEVELGSNSELWVREASMVLRASICSSE